MLPGWAVVVTCPNAEAKAVANTIKLGYSVFYPKLINRRRINGKRIRIICPLFPGYFFTWIERKWNEIREAKGVAGLLMNDDDLATVHEGDMRRLRADCDRNGVYIRPPKKRLTNGQMVKPQFGIFMDNVGWFAGFVGQRETALFNIMGANRRVLFEEGVLIGI